MPIDATNSTNSDRVLGTSGNQYNAVFTDKTDNSVMDQSDFLNLLVVQMQNQDFTNPMDDTQMVTQMAMFSNMQQMQEMVSYAKSNYAMSLLGRTVTASRFTVSGDLDTTTGPVQKVSLVDNEYVFYIGGKKYTMDQIMGIQTGESENVSPIDPSGYELKVGEVTSDSVEISWQVPTEDDYLSSGLTYTVYYSKEPMDSLEDVENATKYGVGQKGNTKEKITGLDAGTTYYVNVVVEDGSGNKGIYKTLTVKTNTEGE